MQSDGNERGLKALDVAHSVTKGLSKAALPSVKYQALDQGFAQCYMRHSAFIFEKHKKTLPSEM
jgi:hypothetical protein